ncbi:MAG TPA: hypothetical protein DCG47_08805 [Spirochaetaceae bacterium]|jgi:hypothetical protein|nr:hypothetical protein [Spirochaetaceae bacterium]
MRVLARASGFEPKRLTLGLGSGAPAPRLLEAVSPAESEEKALYQAGAVKDCPSHADTEAQAMYKPDAVKAASSQAYELPTVMQARKLRPRNPQSSLLPAGQTTQMVIGASPESDRDILVLAENLYLAYDVRRVYYSAYVPTGADPRVPALAGPPLLREHRLYQADWLFRFYGFAASEVLDGGSPNLDAELDPKCAWALRNLQRFPVDVNTAEYLELLRVPGIGPKSAMRIVRARRQAALTPESLGRIGVVMKRARWFLCCSGVPAFDTPARGAAIRAPSIDNPAALRALLGDGASSTLLPLQKEFSFSS